MLARWAGLAFADVQIGEQLSTEARRLEETRLCALDRHIEAVETYQLLRATLVRELGLEPSVDL